METENINDAQDFGNTEIGQKFFKYRDYTPIPLILILFFIAEPTIASAAFGTLFMVFGELFRIYSVAFIGSISRTRSSNTGSNLITSGPFSWMRNPLYVGNFFIVVGVTLFGGIGWLLVLTILLFSLQYYFIVQYEQKTLIEKFGDQYKEYMKVVPPWLPKSAPKLSEIEWPDNFSPALKSEKRTLSAILVLIIGLILVSKT